MFHLQVLADEATRIRVATASGANAGYQFKTHPNIDKALYSSEARRVHLLHVSWHSRSGPSL